MTNFELRTLGGGGSLPEAFAVRRAVFIDEQDVPEAIEMDGRDADATHVVVRDADRDEPVGTARVRFPDDGTAKAERVAVIGPYRGRGLGRRLMRTVEGEARDRGCSRVHLNAQTAVRAFYEDIGYEVVSEDVFYEAGIPHVRMVKHLD